MFSVTKKKSSLFNASQCKKFFPLSIKKKKKEKQIALDLNVYIVISHLDETLGVIYWLNELAKWSSLIIMPSLVQMRLSHPDSIHSSLEDVTIMICLALKDEVRSET